METQLIDLINKADSDREKINYLLLHHYLMPIGYESDLRKISSEVNDVKNKAELSPILIAENNRGMPGSLQVTVHLPRVLKSKIKRLQISPGTVVKKELSAALQLVKECLQSEKSILNLSRCHLQDEDFNLGGPLDNAIRQCTDVTTFILVGNTTLTRFPDCIFQLHELEELHFAGNGNKKSRLVDIPEAITQLQNLKVLDLSNHSISEMPKGIGKLLRLIRLDVHENELKTIPKEVGQLLNLVELNLSNNRLEQIPRSLLDLKRLRRLWINGNPLTDKLPNLPEHDAKEILETLFPPEKTYPKATPSKAFDYTIGGQEAKTEDGEAISAVPNNRTLIVVKLTHDRPTKPEFVEDLTKMSEVYEHYKPEVTFQNRTGDGTFYSETMRFRSIADFSLGAIIANCRTLRELKLKIDQYSRMSKQFKANKLLREILATEEYKSSFVDATKALAAILEDSFRPNEINPSEASAIASNEPSTIEHKNNPEHILERATERMAKFGGFDILEATIENVSNLNPQRKARRKIYLEEPAKSNDRRDLFSALKTWISVVDSGIPYPLLIQECELQRERLEGLNKQNLKAVLLQTRELERSYRSLQLFFNNAETDKVKNVTFLNSALEQLTDLDNDIFINAIDLELRNNFDRLDLRKNYSLLIVPGYLGSKVAVHRLAMEAFKNKVMLVTDFANISNADETMERFDEANLTGGETYLSNVVMVCNWLIGREKYPELDEEEDLFIAPSPALGGKLYSAVMPQVTSGKKYGSLRDVDGVRFGLKKSEIATLDRLGLVPMVSEYGKVMSFSAKTLFTGDNLGLRTYSVVRVFDYISKVLIDFLNRRMFENFSPSVLGNLRKEIVKFLDSVTGPAKLVESFSITRFEHDVFHKDKIHVHLLLEPHFPAKSFLLKLEGNRGDHGTEWQSDYTQQ
jgi:hypothetical protein